MTSRLQWLLLQLTRKLWFRASLFSALAVATALLAILFKRYIPGDLPAKIGAEAVDNILGIIASSMLAVTIFSLSTMVSAYSAATSNVSPRATRLLLEDATAHNALATFIGSFLFSLVGIIALSTGLYGDRGRVILFVATLAVIVFMVATLLHWIDHVSRLGRVGETTDRVEEAAARAMRSRRDAPNLGGMPLPGPGREVPDAAEPLHAGRIGYVQHIDMGALQRLADAHGLRVHVQTLPGAFVDPSRPLALVSGEAGDDVRRDLRRAFTVNDLRSYDQDPRFGASVLAEIASRALSPALNDPGTAIDVIGRAVRLLSIWARPSPPEEPRYPRVHVPSIELADLFDDLFVPIARDGAGIVEVGIRLQKALRALALLDDPRYAQAARHHSRQALARAEAALAIDDDKRRLRALADEVAAIAENIEGSKHSGIADGMPGDGSRPT